MELRNRLHNWICVVTMCIAAAIAASCRTAPDPELVVRLPETTALPRAPELVLDPTVPLVVSFQVESIIKEKTGIDWLAEDSLYFVPTEQNMDTVIRYLGECFEHFGISYVRDGTDCDDFARTKVGLARIILSQAYSRDRDPPLEASPTIFTMFVKQDAAWAGVPAGGAHAVVVYACINRFGDIRLNVWEPQSNRTIAAADYPNRHGVFYVGQEAAKE